jgi:hypothetical protein
MQIFGIEKWEWCNESQFLGILHSFYDAKNSLAAFTYNKLLI